MYGRSSSFHNGGGGGRGVVPPPLSHSAVPSPLAHNYLQRPNVFVQSSNIFPPFNSFVHNPNMLVQNSNLPIQNPNFSFGNHIFHPLQGFQNQPPTSDEALARIDEAVVTARHGLITSGESVTAWKVSQAVVLALQASSWESLGFSMHKVPSLHRLLVTEEKINSFIHCSVAVQRITSLYDLEVAICHNEGIEKFEELELGPFVKHPLVAHYFSRGSNIIEVFKITSKEIFFSLFEFINTHKDKKVRVEKFLDFIAKKRSVGVEKLGVHIQSLGLLISYLKKSRQSENSVLNNCLESLKKKSDRKSRKRPLFSSQKKQLDDHFSDISQRVKVFSTADRAFCGKHIRFISSSSEDEDSNDCKFEEIKDKKNNMQNPCSSSIVNILNSSRVSGCPYPSATEEMTRLVLKSEIDVSSCPDSANLIFRENNSSSKRKRKSENINCTSSVRHKLSKREKAELDYSVDEKEVSSSPHECSDNHDDNLSISNVSTEMFITTWKVACQENDVAKVFERMLQFYKTRKRKKVMSMFSSFPFSGLLSVAVNSMKYGMWNNMYDTIQALSQHENLNACVEKCSIEVEAENKGPISTSNHDLKQKNGATVEDILKKVCMYFELDHDNIDDVNLHVQKSFKSLMKFYKCQFWLAEQFCVKEFESLGHGEFLEFIEKHLHMLPLALQRFLAGDTSEELYLEAHMIQRQLAIFLSQASSNLQENERMSKKKIHELLAGQFPSICFKLDDNGCVEDILGECKTNVVSHSIIFSATLTGKHYMRNLPALKENGQMETTELGVEIIQNPDTSVSLTSQDATKALLSAPMLTALDLWLHWDILYASSLGSLVDWLLNNVNDKELLCMVVRSGKVFRIDPSATPEAFLEAFLQGSSFLAAVKLLSLIALYGGRQNVPSSLLKRYSKRAFEVLGKNHVDMKVYGQSCMVEVQLSHKENCSGKISSGNFRDEVLEKMAIANEVVDLGSKFVLDCLGYIPSEFKSFAMDILLSGLRSVSRDAPVAILNACQQTEQRLMLHEVGLTLGVAEWIKDFDEFCLLEPSDELFMLGSSCLGTGTFEGAPNDNILSQIVLPAETDKIGEDCKDICSTTKDGEVFCHSFSDNHMQNMIDVVHDSDSAKVIESIRQEEFGIDPSLSIVKSSMLKKQHARLGRALHCLSQELYSQDSHFLLELIQNADDNVYPRNAEPTLVFILRDEGIVVLNNEQGFSAENIRALCDVGSSTKKRYSSGYIGKKGIGFKSVFRVTDTPEIHSNGFHIKFDISEGEIGFVLPTIVPPCDIDVFSRQVFISNDLKDNECWNTCIVLPFRTKLSPGFSVNVVSMFSNLHPSLLLFLHRLQCIIFKNMLNDSLVVMRKEESGDGIVKVSLGMEKMNWLVVSKKLQPDGIRPDAQSTEISLAFTLQEFGNGDYMPCLDQQPVFAFLPLKTYGLKFIVQGDFVVTSSREEVDGDSPWNQWLLSEFPVLFVNAEKSFCNLPCFRESPAKAVSAFMSFVPLVGEVHGFFSGLPRLIISKLRLSSCLLVEGDNNIWVPPCKALRNWTEEARVLLPDDMLQDILGLGYLNKEIVISDSLARALGIEEYGPKILLQIMTSLCHTENGLKALGFGWLFSWINAIYVLTSNFSSQLSSKNFGNETDILTSLRKLPFIPLSNGKYGSVEEGTIWLHTDFICMGSADDYAPACFTKLFSHIRIVSASLFPVATATSITSSNGTLVENVTTMLYRIGVQQLSAHEIIRVHILPAVFDVTTVGDRELMIEYFSFLMFHLQSHCQSCCSEKENIISELCTKAFVLTNHGFKRLIEMPIHFSNEFGNPVDISNFFEGMDFMWREVDNSYLKHPVTTLVSDGVLKWRIFFQGLGVSDFVQVVQTKRTIADASHIVLKNLMSDRDMISPGSFISDWESEELVQLLSQLSSNSDLQRCKYILEVFDTLWDDCFHEKVTGQYYISAGKSIKFKSSFISAFHNVQWIASSTDDELHLPKDLFHDCESVRLVLGSSAPYTIPKVRSEMFIKDIGFKIQITFEDAISNLKIWRRSRMPFKTSILQMSRFYSFMWNEILASRAKVSELLDGAFIFVPSQSIYSREDIVLGVFLSPQDVFWHDAIDCMEQLKSVCPDFSQVMSDLPFSKVLSGIYPGFHDFFVTECGVDETPSFYSYLNFLLKLSTFSLPSQAARMVFQLFVQWTDGLNSGLVTSQDVAFLKESLHKVEHTVLPTTLDKWVSLHPSFGLLCWCDDESLGKEFKHFEDVDFLYFGKLSGKDKEILQSKVSILLKRLGIPALSEVVIREAIFSGLHDSAFKASLMNFALPYAQRYIHNMHPEKYVQLKLSGFESIKHLQIIVVEKLFYRNVVKKAGIISKKLFECSCLLQGDVLYTTQDSDSHSLFMELSRLLFDGCPDLHFANFLHMISNMAESTFNDEKMEFFILNSQKLPRLPIGEPAWTLASSATENGKGMLTAYPPSRSTEPVSFEHANGSKSQVDCIQQNLINGDHEEIDQKNYVASVEINSDWTIEDNPCGTSLPILLPTPEFTESHSCHSSHVATSGMNAALDPFDPVTTSGCSAAIHSVSSKRDQLSFGTANPQQALLTGRIGEFVAYRHFVEKSGEISVKWVNETNETGLPYDIVVGDKNNVEYIEVKATKSARKDWFDISVREWQFATEKGESFSIAHVVLLGNNMTKITIYKNPARLCQLSKLKLAVIVPKK